MITIIALLGRGRAGRPGQDPRGGPADATKATIAKLNDLVMRKYESYMTRRLPINVSAQNLSPKAAMPRSACRPFAT